MPSPTQKRGSEAEACAERYLLEHGLQNIERNYSSKFGEIDLIMQDKDSLVFVEVRYRDKETHGSGIETVTYSKRRKIIKTATCYLLEKNLWDKVPCRFDVVGLANRPGEEIMWLKDAFWVK